MLADADHFAMVENDDLVGVHDGADALGDDDAGRVGKFFGDAATDRFVGLVVEGREGVIKDEDLRFGSDGPGDAKALLLAAGEVAAALGDFGIIAVALAHDEAIGIGDFGGPADVLEGHVRILEGDVLFDVALEEESALRGIADAVAEVFLQDILDVDAVDEDFAAGAIGHTGNHVDDGGLARARRADEGDGLALLDLEGNIGDGFLIRTGIGKADVFEFDGALFLEFDRVLGVEDRDGVLDDFLDTLGADGRTRPDDNQGDQEDEGHDDLAGEHDEGVGGGEGRVGLVDAHAVDDIGTRPQNGEGEAHHDEHDKGGEEGEDAAVEDLDLGEGGVDLFELAFLIGFGVEGADDADAGEVFAGGDVQGVGELLDDFVFRRHHEQQDDDRHDEEDEPNRGDEGQGSAGVLDQEDDGPHHRNRGDEGRLQEGEPGEVHVLHVVGRPGDQRLGREGGEVGNGEFVDPLVHFVTEHCHGAGGSGAGHEADDDFHHGHADGADNHVEAVPPNFGNAILLTGLHRASQQTDVTDDLHHEENLGQGQEKNHHNRDPLFRLQVFEE